MIIKIFESASVSATYFGALKFTGQFRAVSRVRVTMFTKDHGLLLFPFTDIEYIESAEKMNLIAILSQMEDFNISCRINVETSEIPEEQL
jgi:hypothetical protein